MPFIDKSIQKKIQNQNSKITKKISNAKDADAKTASRISSVQKPTAEKVIASIIALIGIEAQKGNYGVNVPVQKQFLGPAAKYFINKKYIVGNYTKGSTTKLIICWAGGKHWRNNVLGPGKLDNSTIGKFIFSTVLEIAMQDDKINIGDIQWNHPIKSKGSRISTESRDKLASWTSNLP